MAYHTVGLHADGPIYTWGSNNYGQLGDGATTDRYIPVKVLKGEYSGTTYLGDNPSNKIVAVALGYYHSIALAADGTVYTWGYNYYGQLGNNSTTNSSTPVKALKGEYGGTQYLGDNPSNKITAVVLGDYHSIALAADNTVFTWGRNNYGQLGDNSTTDKYTPVKVKGVGGVGDLSLPVELSSFTATLVADGVQLKWRAETEVGNIGFSIYRNESQEGPFWEIGWVRGAGNSGMPINYQFTDKTAQPGHTYFYYIENVDIEGLREKSKFVKITLPEKQPIVIPSRTALFQNFPNPFNPETWLPYELATDATVAIGIYDANGQFVRQLNIGAQKAGSYLDKEKAAYWDGKDQTGKAVSSGIYFYTLKAGDFQVTKRMVIVK
jgi:hypothetical protein